jgi:hypothetical protein
VDDELKAIEVSRDLLREMTERYEEMFAQFQSMRRVLVQSGNLNLLTQYASMAANPAYRSSVHAQFEALYDEIAKLSLETKARNLIAKIPQAQTEG